MYVTFLENVFIISSIRFTTDEYHKAPSKYLDPFASDTFYTNLFQKSKKKKYGTVKQNVSV